MSGVRRGLVAVGALVLAGCGAGTDAPGRYRSQPVRFIPQSVSFVSPNLGWAWGPASWPQARSVTPGVLARTADGGETWSTLRTPKLPYAQPGFGPGISGVRFATARVGYLFGTELLQTNDAGAHWHRIRIPGPILDIEIADQQAYALARSCAVCRLANLYRIVRDTLVPTLHSPMSSEGSSLVARGSGVYVLTAQLATQRLAGWSSRDRGMSWNQFGTPCNSIGAGFSALAAWSDLGLALACGGEPGVGFQAKTFYSSTDGGLHWKVAGRIPGLQGGMSPGYIASLSAANARTWVLAEARGAILVTHDGGRDWTAGRFIGPVRGPVEGWGYVSFNDPAHAVAVPWTLNGDVLAFSSDGGRTWREAGFEARTTLGR